MKRNNETIAVTLVALLTVAAAPARADGPESKQTLNVQGILRSMSGELQSSAVGLVVRLYASRDASDAFYSQVFETVPVENGFFSVELSGMGLSFASDDAWVGIKVAGDANEMPRQHLTAVPYAFSARTAASAAQADMLSGNCSGCVTDGMVGAISAAKVMGIPGANAANGANAVKITSKKVLTKVASVQVKVPTNDGVVFVNASGGDAGFFSHTNGAADTARCCLSDNGTSCGSASVGYNLHRDLPTLNPGYEGMQFPLAISHLFPVGATAGSVLTYTLLCEYVEGGANGFYVFYPGLQAIFLPTKYAP
jgi:hypothetical protein